MSYIPKSVNVPTFSLSGDTIHLNELIEKDKQELAEELVWLREATKDALQKSWNEVESLQRQCARHVEVKARLDAQLTDSKADEEVWRLRYLAADEIHAMTLEQEESHADSLSRPRSAGSLQGINKASSVQFDNNTHQSSEKKPLLKFCDKIRSWSGVNLRGMEDDAKNLNMHFTPSMSSSLNKRSDKNEAWYKAANNKMQEVLEQSVVSSSMENLDGDDTTNTLKEDYFIESLKQTTSEADKTNQLYLNGNAKSQEDLSLTIFSRDQIIVSLEQTLNQQLNNLQNMQAEMVCLMESQRLKEKWITASHQQNEQRLDKLIESLQRKLKRNEISSKGHDEALSEFKLYIQELTDELERMLKIIKTAEERGFLLDCNFSP